jgi:hypothetical protein
MQLGRPIESKNLSAKQERNRSLRTTQKYGVNSFPSNQCVAASETYVSQKGENAIQART